ncbi:pilus assembly FimT family protein [Acinetobacter wanghuae]|nr:prepilin-type N-terminal cleavage/methylation domain-containing protein [Acinetobacter wanghuae]
MIKKRQHIMPQKGLTLIELMITISLITIVLFMGSSLTSAWIDQSQVNNATSSIQNAISQAKAIALRNKNNTTLNETAASVCLYPWQTSPPPSSPNPPAPKKVIKVIYGSCPISEPSEAIYSVILPDINVIQGATYLNCLDFNYIGVLTPSSTCSATANPTLTIGKNNETATIVIR